MNADTYEKPVNYIFEFVKSKSMVAVYVIVFITVYGYINVMNRRREILDKWDEYRYNIAIIPFAGYLKPLNGRGAAMSSWLYFLDFLFMVCKKAFGFVIEPIGASLKLLTKLASDMTVNADMIRKQIAVIRNMIADIVMSIYSKIESMLNAAQYAFSRIENVLKRSAAIFQVIVHYVEVMGAILTGMAKKSFSTLISVTEVLLWYLPYLALNIPGFIFPIMAVCFDAQTPILLKDGSQKYIRDVKLGDVLYDGGRVISKMRVRVRVGMYVYRGIRVSGSHYVLEKGDWVKVCDSEEAVASPFSSVDAEEYIYNLNTTTHRIFAISPNTQNPVIFMDYDETSVLEDVEKENRAVLEALGQYASGSKGPSYNRRYRIGYSSPPVAFGEHVYGYIQHLVEDSDVIYRIGTRYMTEWVKVRVYGNDIRWVCARDHPEAVCVPVGDADRPELLWTVVTADHTVDLGDGIVVRDLLEV